MEALIETRNEYVEHIQDILGIAISKRINKMWEESENNIKKFQSELTQIKKWNNNIINEEYKKIVKYTKCKYLYNLIKIIIINTIKIKIYEYRDQFDNIKIKIPAAEDYIHKCYMNIASFSWKNAYLFVNKGIKDVEHQNNLNIIEENIKIIIKKTFRDFIPYYEILDQIDESLTDNVSQFKDETDTKHKSSTKSKEFELEIEEEDEDEDEDDNEEEDEDKDKDEDEDEEEEEDKDDNEEEEEDKDDNEEEEEEEDKDDNEEEEEDDNEEKEEDEDDNEDKISTSKLAFNNTLQVSQQPPQELPQETSNESDADTEKNFFVEPKPVNLFEPMKEEFIVNKDNISNEVEDINVFKSLLPEPITEDDKASITSDMSYIKEIHISDSQDKKKKLSFF